MRLSYECDAKRGFMIESTAKLYSHLCWCGLFVCPRCCCCRCCCCCCRRLAVSSSHWCSGSTGVDVVERLGATKAGQPVETAAWKTTFLGGVSNVTHSCRVSYARYCRGYFWSEVQQMFISIIVYSYYHYYYWDSLPNMIFLEVTSILGMKPCEVLGEVGGILLNGGAPSLVWWSMHRRLKQPDT